MFEGFSGTLLNLGGTITEAYVADGTMHRVDGRTLLTAAQLSAQWTAHDISPCDSVELTFHTVFRMKEVIAADRTSRAFIACCGTDLLEDFAYAAALLLPLDRPVVFTAAALPHSAAGADGPANLRRAAQLAASVKQPTVLVVMSDTVFEPRGLVKLDPQAAQPYGAIDGARGRMRAEQAILSDGHAVETAFRCLDLADCGARVAILAQGLGTDIDFADPDRLEGLVVAGAGAGGMSLRTYERLRREFLPAMPVVLSTRCPFGFTTNPALPKYALSQARADGFLIDDYAQLNATQARIRLILQIGRTRSIEI